MRFGFGRSETAPGEVLCSNGGSFENRCYGIVKGIERQARIVKISLQSKYVDWTDHTVWRRGQRVKSLPEGGKVRKAHF